VAAEAGGAGGGDVDLGVLVLEAEAQAVDAVRGVGVAHDLDEALADPRGGVDADQGGGAFLPVAAGLRQGVDDRPAHLGGVLAGEQAAQQHRRGAPVVVGAAAASEGASVQARMAARSRTIVGEPGVRMWGRASARSRAGSAAVAWLRTRFGSRCG
jgi:hypothetical protein